MGEKELDAEHKAIEAEAGAAGVHFDGSDNIEYRAMLNALDSKMGDLRRQMQKIEEDNGIMNKTDATWKNDYNEPQDTINVMDVFAAEINN